MLHYLGGGSSKSASDYYGRKIASASKSGDGITLTFDDGVSVFISDKGQSCCESRYMTVEDDITGLAGKTLRSIDVREANADGGNDDCRHEIAFLEFKTDDGVAVTCSFHNEHNGYYGGFGLDVSEVGTA